MHRRDFVCIFTNNRRNIISSYISGTPHEIESVIKKLILSKKQGKTIFWKKVIA